jgi:hypothetical protein
MLSFLDKFDRHVPAQRLDFLLRTGAAHSRQEQRSRQA